MRRRTTPTLIALLVATAPAFAQFEGVLAMKLAVEAPGGAGGGTGTMNVSVSKAGTRSEVDMQMGTMGIKTVMLQRNDTPNTLIRINDASKTYTEFDQSKAQTNAAQRADAKRYTVEKLGQETLLGYKTQHVRVKEENAANGKGAVSEVWTAKELLDYATFSKMQAGRNQAASEAALLKALKGAGADGMPLKSVTTTGDGTRITMEVVSVDKKSLPASTFEVPAGYTKSAGGLMDTMAGMSGPQADEAKKQLDDAKKRMNEALKNMTPEQRAMFEKMMQQRQSSGQ